MIINMLFIYICTPDVARDRNEICKFDGTKVRPKLQSHDHSDDNMNRKAPYLCTFIVCKLSCD